MKKLTVILLAIAFGMAMQAQTTVTATYGTSTISGTGTITIPQGATNVNGELWGAGGGGGGARACGWGAYRAAAGASAGGGGGYSIQNFGNNTGSFSITVGKGGQGTVSGSGEDGIECNTTIVGGSSRQHKECKTADAGGDSKIVHSSATVTAGGGGGGKSAAADAEAGGSVNYSAVTNVSGGLGNAGSGGPGEPGSANNDPKAKGGNGGMGYGGGLGGNGTEISCNSSCLNATSGNPGNFPGGGGSGASAVNRSDGNCSNANGNTGANGRVILNFTLPKPAITALYSSNYKCNTLSVQNPSSDATYTWKLGSTVKGTGTSINTSEAGNWTVTAAYSIAYTGLTPTFNVALTDNKVEVASDGKNLATVPAPSSISQAYEDVCPTASSIMVTWASLVGANNANLKWYNAETGGSLIPEPVAFDGSIDFAATYWVSQTIDGCESARTKVNVNINESPVPNIIPIDTCATTGTINWDEVVVPESGSAIHWYTNKALADADYANGNHTNEESMPVAKDLSVVGTYTIWVILERTATGCHSVVSPAVIEVKPVPAPISDYNPSAICEGEGIDYQPNADLTYSYKDVVNATSVSLTNLTVSENIAVTAKNTSGCDVTFNVNITVNPKPDKTNETPDAICFDEAVPFTPAENVVYTFTPRENAIGATTTDNITSVSLENTTGALQTVIYDVTQQNSVTGCVGVPFTLTINVKPEHTTPPTLERAAEIGDNGVEADWETEMEATVNWVADPDAIGYILNIYEGTTLIGANVNVSKFENSHTIDIAKGNAYKVEVTAQYDCNETSEILTFAFDEDGTTQLPKTDFAKFNVWSSNGKLYINSSQNGEVTIYSIVGKPLSTLRLNADQTASIALPQGVYLLKSGAKAVKAMIN
ncbi:MAG: DUF6383 domain-containing protein [Prevotellaceae bacterium]|jgi:hypothetical protein|nr:DUF6383 domain-containing protein [Prevotellaceae bacterium]